MFLLRHRMLERFSQNYIITKVNAACRVQQFITTLILLNAYGIGIFLFKLAMKRPCRRKLMCFSTASIHAVIYDTWTLIIWALQVNWKISINRQKHTFR